MYYLCELFIKQRNQTTLLGVLFGPVITEIKEIFPTWNTCDTASVHSFSHAALFDLTAIPARNVPRCSL